MTIQESLEYQTLFEKWNKLANKITYSEPTPENFRELARMSLELSSMTSEQKDIPKYVDLTILVQDLNRVIKDLKENKEESIAHLEGIEYRLNSIWWDGVVHGLEMIQDKHKSMIEEENKPNIKQDQCLMCETGFPKEWKCVNSEENY